MSDRLRNIMDNYDKLKIGLDDTFRFHCTMCGKCCINREDIILNPSDLYYMAKELGVEPKDVYTEYCESYLGETSRMVIVRIVPVGSIKRCPFLKERKCSIHKGKPTVCALFPLGRALKANTDDKNFPSSAQDVEYIFQSPDCGDASETHTVREWLKDYEHLTDATFFVKWFSAIADYADAIKKVEKRKSKELLDTVSAAILIYAYLNYNMDEDFLPQFEENDKKLREVFDIALPSKTPK